jgi:hypothetical protein
MDGENVTAQGIDEMCEDGQRGERKGQSIGTARILDWPKTRPTLFPSQIYALHLGSLSLSIFLPAKQYDSHV